MPSTDNLAPSLNPSSKKKDHRGVLASAEASSHGANAATSPGVLKGSNSSWLFIYHMNFSQSQPQRICVKKKELQSWRAWSEMDGSRVSAASYPSSGCSVQIRHLRGKNLQDTTSLNRTHNISWVSIGGKQNCSPWALRAQTLVQT